MKGGRYSDVAVNTGLAVIILLIFGNLEQGYLQMNKQTKKQTNRYKTIAKITKLRKNIISLLIFGNSEQTCLSGNSQLRPRRKRSHSLLGMR